MIYKFKKYNISSNNEPESERDYDYGLDYNFLNANEKGLFGFNSHIWTSEEIQDMLDEINSITTGNDFEYSVEGGHLLIVADKEETHLFNLLNKTQKKADIIWTTEKFIQFLMEFKVFLQKNGR